MSVKDEAKSTVTSPTKIKQRENEQENRGKAFDLYTLGHNYRDIAKTLDCGVSHVTIFNWIKKELKAGVERRASMADEHVEAEGNRLDHIIRVAMKDLEQSIKISFNAKDGKLENRLINRIDPKVAKLVIDAIKTKAKLFGMNKPEVLEVTGSLTLKQLVQEAAAVTPEMIEAEYVALPAPVSDETPSSNEIG